MRSTVARPWKSAWSLCLCALLSIASASRHATSTGSPETVRWRPAFLAPFPREGSWAVLSPAPAAPTHRTQVLTPAVRRWGAHHSYCHSGQDLRALGGSVVCVGFPRPPFSLLSSTGRLRSGPGATEGGHGGRPSVLHHHRGCGSANGAAAVRSFELRHSGARAARMLLRLASSVRRGAAPRQLCRANASRLQEGTTAAAPSHRRHFVYTRSGVPVAASVGPGGGRDSSSSSSVKIKVHDIKPGMSVVIDGILYKILSLQHTVVGRGSSFTRTKLRNLSSGGILDKTLRSTDGIEEAETERSEYIYSYKDDDTAVFQDPTTWEEHRVPVTQIQASLGFMKEGSKVSVVWWRGRIIDVSLDNHSTFRVVKVKTADRSNYRHAVIETGAQVLVPSYVEEGDAVVVNTNEGTFVKRPNK
eukprot:GHVU01105335.1.p1 GENE.GHVU01105335.1~~GHVU01105335.1.p1  ORF type:complete len:416 (-),score=40.20 GHVU01105335.1:639-1886(-)